jgi:hypothetical protein
MYVSRHIRTSSRDAKSRNSSMIGMPECHSWMRLQLCFSVTNLKRRASRPCECNNFLFPSRIHASPHLSTRQYARIVDSWVLQLGLDPANYGTHTLRRTKATLIYRRTKNLRAVQLLLGHTKLESTVRYQLLKWMMPWRWRNRLKREGRRRSATTVADRPNPVIYMIGMPARKRSFGINLHTFTSMIFGGKLIPVTANISGDRLGASPGHSG